MDELSEMDYVVIDQFIPDELYELIRGYFIQNLPEFSKAGVGALSNNTIQTEIIGDHTFWLERARDTHLHELWEILDDTLSLFRRYCFLSLSGYEFHFANYPPQTHYVKHLDQFKGNNNRMISLVIYLNADWQNGDGGELELFLKNKTSVIIEPIANRCVMFKSAELPHRVLKSKKNRYSLTGWLLNLPSTLDHFLT